MMQLHEVARLMDGFDHPWWFAGGWAIELFVGRPLREHGDLEIGIWRDDQMALREHFSRWRWDTAITVDGAGQWVPWNIGEWMELPNFQLKANRIDDSSQELEFMLNDASDGQFRFRRQPSITLSVDKIVGQSRKDCLISCPKCSCSTRQSIIAPKTNRISPRRSNSCRSTSGSGSSPRCRAGTPTIRGSRVSETPRSQNEIDGVRCS